MKWTKLNFGRHEGRSLPWVLWHDSDWFFWAIESQAFVGREELAREAVELFARATSIRLKDEDEGKLVEYIVHPSAGGFVTVSLVDPADEFDRSSNAVCRLAVLDMSVPRQISSYDKLGNTLFLKFLKAYFFGDPSYQMTGKRSATFFEDEDNFILQPSAGSVARS